MQAQGGVIRGMGGWASLWAEWKRTLWVSPSLWHHSIVGWWGAGDELLGLGSLFLDRVPLQLCDLEQDLESPKASPPVCTVGTVMLTIGLSKAGV